ncbi:MAG: dTDP-4-dehydrorhamnose 3,5-epimerase [Anaerolineaceae bacterium]|jgi:dTDP-4-dehydrorhamnose 3,5-epimerase|nr:dTDP-4-dehydrorhamnose 3,5-epimerase [Anaerolineaceae bacterium]OQY88665.1 MAG: dTDP-4-dehydrorhamnose 3,5-epimerase [Anaerolineae bacterium UTCFX1]
MNVETASIPDVLILTPRIYEDARGFFMETYQADKFAQIGIKTTFVQDNYSRSSKGVLRGLHYQIRQPQGKLVQAVLGEVFDVAVDLRRASPTFGQWAGVHLSAENKRQVWVPPGFAHGYYVISDWAEIMYKTTDYYAPQWERTLLWNDPLIGIAWRLTYDAQPLLSSKDQAGLPLSQAEVYEEPL